MFEVDDGRRCAHARPDTALADDAPNPDPNHNVVDELSRTCFPVTVDREIERRPDVRGGFPPWMCTYGWRCW